MRKGKIKADAEQVRLVADCLVNSLTILAQKEMTDLDVTLNFINNNDLRGLKHYLEAIRKKGE